MSREVDIINQVPGFQCQEIDIENLVYIMDQYGEFFVPDGSLCVVFVEPAVCSQIHQQHFNDASVTDVMTFPGDPEDEHAGDIIVCPEFARDAAEEYQQPFANEIILYIIHGWLHLAGLRDKTEEEQQQMRSAEETLMSYIESKSPFPRISMDNL